MLLSSLCFVKHQKVWRYRISQSLKLGAHIYFSCPVGIVEALSFTQKGKTDPGNAEFMPNMFCILQSICHILQHSCFILQNICFVLQYICLLWEGDEWWLTCAIYAKNLFKKLPTLQPPVSGSQRLEARAGERGQYCQKLFSYLAVLLKLSASGHWPMLKVCVSFGFVFSWFLRHPLHQINCPYMKKALNHKF